MLSQKLNIPVAALRVWERRYDFPHLHRTVAGHRLYSENDICHLQWVKVRISEGMRTQQAIRAFHLMDGTTLIQEH